MDRIKTIIAAIVLVCMAYEAHATGVANRRFPVTVDEDTLYQRYASNFELTGSKTLASLMVTRVVFAVHGTGTSNATSYCDAILDEADTAGVTSTVAIICPQWVRLSDDEDETIYDERNVAVSPADTWAACTGTYDDDLFYGANWIEGDESFTGSGQTGTGGTCTARAFLISSFEVFDQMLAAAATQFPFAHDIVITGHSAGGQMVNLYALMAQSPWPNNQVKFAPMNPSSSPYFDDMRPLSESGGSFSYSTPVEADCTDAPDGGVTDFSEYNLYKYAFVDVSPDDDEADGSSTRVYVSGLSYDAIIAEFPDRRYLRVAELSDADPNEATIANNCPNFIQGTNRLYRADAYVDHILNYFGDSGWEQWVKGNWDVLYTNHGDQHGGIPIFQSKCGIYYVLDVDDVDPVSGNNCSNRDAIRLSEDGDETDWTIVGDISSSTPHHTEGAYSFLFAGNASATSADLGAGTFTIAGGIRMDPRALSTESVKVEVNIDGGGWTTLFSVVSGTDEENTWHYNGGHVLATTSLQVRVISAFVECGAWVDGLRVTKRPESTL